MDDTLEWELEQLGALGYRPFLVACVNDKGHVRSISTLKAADLLEALLTMARDMPEEIEEMGA